mmetsp:Transcript_30556/g.35857  ORF Transcript_30556/g.35857 Transcript_30556/m.35857 type:complete len:110 (+) Transcript_30556:147-476(+)
MIRMREQILHFAVCIDHVFLCVIYVIPQLLNTHVLALDLRIEVLRFIFDSLGNADDFIKLLVLVPEHVFLVLEDLAVVQIARLVKLTLVIAHVLVAWGVPLGGSSELLF